MALMRLDAPAHARPPQGKPASRPAFSTFIPGLIAAAVGIALSVAAYVSMTNVERENEAVAISRRATANVGSLKSQIAHYLNIGIGVRALFAATSGQVNRDEFRAFASEVLSLTPEVWSLGFVERVREENRPAFEEAVAAQGMPGLAISEMSPEGKLIPAASRPLHYVLTYLESKNRGSNVGFDLASLPGREKMFRNVIVGGHPVVICEIALSGEPGFVILVPIYRSGKVPESAGDREADLLGMANVTLKAESMVTAALGPANIAALDLYLYENTEQGPRFFYGRGAGNEPLKLDADRALARATEDGTIRRFAVVGREWTAAFLPRFPIRPFDRGWTAPLALALGLTLTALISGYLFLLIDRTRRVGEEVALRTEELSELNRALGHEIVDRRAAENQVAAERTNLLDAINSIPSNFLLWDASDRLVLWNDHADRSLRASGHGEVLKIGTTFDQFIEGSSRRIAEHDGPADSAAWEANRKRIHRSGGTTGEIKLRSGRWLYISEHKTKDGGTATLYFDVTERKNAEKQLRTTNRVLETLIRACPLAICVVDQENRVELWNPAAERTFGWSAEEVIGKSVPYLPPGRPRRGMVRSLVAREGRLVGMEDIRVRKDGTTVPIECYAAPLHDDAGEITRLLVVSVDITQRKETEAALRISEERYRELIARAPDAMIVHDGSGRILFANEAAARLHGVVSPDALAELGDPVELLHPDDRAKVRRSRRHALAGRRAGPPEEVRWIAKGGSIVQIETSSTPVEWDGRPCVLLEARDITERKLAEKARNEAEEALRESEDRYRHLIEVSPDAIFVHINDTIRFANGAAAKLMGEDFPDAIIGRPVAEHIDPAYLLAFDNYKKILAREGRVNINEIKWRRRDGTSIFVDGSAGLFTFQGEPATQLIARDVTARKAAETAMREAKEAAETANRSKSEFLANVSHELRTPLNAIIGFSEVMEHEMFGKLGNEHYRDYARDIRLSGTHLLEVINDILDLAKVEAGKVELQEQSIDLVRIVESTVRLVRERAGERNIDLSVRLPESLPRLWADERKVKQILINLLSNAIKFTPEGGSVTVSAERDASDAVHLSVSDTGIGIAKESLETVLEPFGQVDSALSRKHAGTGLGLPLTKSLVELHGGRLDLDSELGKGTTVVVRFPHERLVA
jgi:PAS domain S-box-containing protein